MSLVVLMTALLLVQQAPAAAPDADTCLACHTDPQLSTTTVDGKPLALHVDASVFAKSVHARLACADCHTGKSEVPHEPRNFSSHRDLTLAYDEQCRRCHFANYTKTLDSVHQASVARGDRTAPVCVDCHGSHDIQKPSAAAHAHLADLRALPRGCRRVVRARACTAATSRAPATADVPVCTDCHRSHDIGGPHQQQWELQTPELCGRCHANETLMKKYGLSTAVLRTYLADFHGKTASLRQHQGTTPNGRVVARCTDCHGVHDIQKASDPTSPVMKANLQKTCTKCHADANANFPGAWLSHYEPSLAEGADRLRREDRLRRAHPVHDRRARSPDPAAPLAADGESMKDSVVRFSRVQRVEHATVMSLFALLALTGLPQKFYDHGWAQTLMGLLGGVDTARWVHRAAGIMFSLVVVVHISRLVVGVSRGTIGADARPDATGLPRRDHHAALLPRRSRSSRRGSTGSTTARSSSTGASCSAPASSSRPGFVLLYPATLTRFLPGELVPASQRRAQQRGADGVPRRHRLAHLQRPPEPGRVPVRHVDLHRAGSRRSGCTTSTRWSTSGSSARSASKSPKIA